ncbi:hypothetical protein [Pseudomonas schmalbachii]|uniref:Uncharacterized protein n=1 Tax=Pseudomonas schmalbachii TaxID=2816993 RepID=A0ABS3TM04_9PSED|nr:hypothetical protein [Pseudomonas schmalbachii]MBO3273614.1 hypothetical protein [Pseudomonas schmalbachii]
MSDYTVYMGDIVRSVLGSEYFLEDITGGWSEFSLVVTVADPDECSGCYGYAYDDNGDWYAATPKVRDIEDSVIAYREALKAEYEVGFKKILFQFNKKTRRVNVQFEFEDSGRWKITPSNLDEMIATLRPNLF